MVRGKSRDLSSMMADLIGGLDRKSRGGYSQMRVAKAWTDLAGPMVDEHTAGAHMRGSELVVFVDSPLWATELSALSEHYRKAMNEALGKEMVGSVRFTVSKHVAERKALDTPAPPEQEGAAEGEAVSPEPLTEQELAQIVESASVIPNEELRQAVIRATVADFEWKKGRRAAKKRQAASEGR